MTPQQLVTLSLPSDFAPEFRLMRGWSDHLAHELVRRAHEPNSIKWTPRDHRERFPDYDSAHQWYHSTTPRIIYGLFIDDVLAGVVWYSFSPRNDLGANFTMAIRLYDAARGKRLSVPLLLTTEQDALSSSPVPIASIWLETDIDNEPAKHTYAAAGYQTVVHTDNRLTMIKPTMTKK